MGILLLWVSFQCPAWPWGQVIATFVNYSSLLSFFALVLFLNLSGYKSKALIKMDFGVSDFLRAFVSQSRQSFGYIQIIALRWLQQRPPKNSVSWVLRVTQHLVCVCACMTFDWLNNQSQLYFNSILKQPPPYTEQNEILFIQQQTTKQITDDDRR